MSRILLIHQKKVQHYRVPVYNYIASRLSERASFTVVSEGVQSGNPYEVQYNSVDIHLNFRNLRRLIKRTRPNILILWVNPKHTYLFPLLIYCLVTGIRIIQWSHGIDLENKHSLLKNIMYMIIHKLVSVCLLYSEAERVYIKKDENKIFVANNTLNFNAFPRIESSKTELKKKYAIKEKKTTLFVGNIQERKRLDQLLAIFDGDLRNIGLVIVGPNLQKEHLDVVERNANIYYLGEIYDLIVINEIFKMCDVFCIPGHIGLGLNQAFFWGLPVVTTDVDHAPEIIYLKNGVNGFITPKGDLDKLKAKISYLLSNPRIYQTFSCAARSTVREEASIEIMSNGFREAIDFVSSRKKGLQEDQF